MIFAEPTGKRVILQEQVDDYERKLLTEALAAGGTRAEVAWMLGMSIQTLWRKLKKYGLDE